MGKKKKERVLITFEDWSYNCGDGCCTSFGTKLLLNNEELQHPNPEILDNNYIGDDVRTALESVLIKLGYEVDFFYKY